MPFSTNDYYVVSSSNLWFFHFLSLSSLLLEIVFCVDMKVCPVQYERQLYRTGKSRSHTPIIVPEGLAD